MADVTNEPNPNATGATTARTATDGMGRTAGDSAQRPRHTRLIAAFIGGLVGGVLVLVLGLLVLPEFIQRRVDQALAGFQIDPQIQQRLAAVEQDVKPLEESPGQIQALQQQLGTVQSSVAGVDARTGEISRRLDDLANLGQQQAALGDRITKLENRPEPEPVDLGPVNAAIDTVKQSVTDLNGTTDQLGSRIGEIASTNEATVRRVDTLTAALADTEQRLNQRSEQLTDRLAANESALSGRLATLNQTEAALASVQATLADQGSRLGGIEQKAESAAAKAEQASGAVEERLGAAEQSLSQRFARNETAATSAVALSEVDAALESGRPFPTAQVLIERAGATDETLAKAADLLRAAAPVGVPTRQQLMTQLEDLRQPAPAGETTGGGDWVEQTRQNILGLVQIRRSGEAATGNAGAPVVAEGDLAGAVQAVAQRADAAQEPVAGWLAKARARLDAEAGQTLLRQHLDQLLSSPS